MRNISFIIIHCSDSTWGNTVEINRWHKARGWLGCGYHYVILNQHHSYRDIINGSVKQAGIIEKGRPDEMIGAHVKGHNSDSIGICLIGKKRFHPAQLYAVHRLVLYLCKKYDVPINNVLGHYELNKNKTCPNLKMNRFRRILRILRFFRTQADESFLDIQQPLKL